MKLHNRKSVAGQCGLIQN